MLCLTSRRRLIAAAGRPEWVLPALFAAVNVFLAWAVYPLNREPLVWDAQMAEGRKVAEMFAPTDRIARVKPVSCRERADKIACYRERLFAGAGEPRRYHAGYGQSPALELTAVKSITQAEVGSFIFGLLKAEGVNVPSLRWFESQPPIFRSRLFDISAVRYLFSEFQIDETDTLRLAYQGSQFYLYENKDAWPYFYIANQVSLMRNYDDLLGARRGEAYLWSLKQPVDTTRWRRLGNESDVSIQLTVFTQGEMEFAYSAKKESFLVVADAWHPRWKASIDGTETGVFKTNGVFKGVLIPEGRHVLKLYFDTTPYQPGIFVSLVSATIFLSGLVYVRMQRRKGDCV